MDQMIIDDGATSRPHASPRPDDAPEARIAQIVSVTGTQMVGLLDDGVGGRGNGARPMPKIGNVMKVPLPDSTVFALVTGLEVPEAQTSGHDRTHSLVKLEMFGEIEHGGRSGGSFQRGVSVYPTLHDAIHCATSADLRAIYVHPELRGIRIGTLQQDETLAAYAMSDDLLGKHFAVLGTSGSGKSCAVAVILRAILSEHRKAHILVMDPHDEYGAAFGDLAEVIRPDSLELPYWLLNAEELAELVIGSDARDALADRAILNQLIARARREWPQNAPLHDEITVDTPVPYRLSDVFRLIDEMLGKLERPADLPAYLRIRDRLHQLQSDRRYAFMFPRLILRDNMAKILSRLFRIPVDGKPMAILDIASLPSDVLNVVASLLFRLTFDFALWTEHPMPILLVCEEAHRYAPADTQTLFEPTKRGLMRIAKEGRKYGVSLCMVSQRPSELATTVLSQCNTIFALRMTSQKDQDFLAAALPESSIGLMAELPALRGGEAIAVGEGISVPARIRFDRLPEDMQPRSQTPPFGAAWNQDLASADFVLETIARWRGKR